MFVNSLKGSRQHLSRIIELPDAYSIKSKSSAGFEYQLDTPGRERAIVHQGMNASVTILFTSGPEPVLQQATAYCVIGASFRASRARGLGTSAY